MVDEVFSEVDILRAAFAEACFLLMREMRYGIGGCGECGDVEVLEAKWFLAKTQREEEN